MDDNEQKIRCNDCYWTGQVKDLIIDDNDREHCPQCKRPDCLMDIE